MAAAAKDMTALIQSFEMWKTKIDDLDPSL